jgi:hypothetical protein
MRAPVATFPGVDQLPPNAQGALVSLVFNRGPGMYGDCRREMRAVRDPVVRKDLPEIARQIRAMKCLWEGQGLDGLLQLVQQVRKCPLLFPCPSHSLNPTAAPSYPVKRSPPAAILRMKKAVASVAKLAEAPHLGLRNQSERRLKKAFTRRAKKVISTAE